LRMKEWLVWAISAGLAFSIVAFFFDWRIALSGLIFFYLFLRVAGLFSNEVGMRTVHELTKKITRNNYLEVRRQKGTINRNEIFRTIQDTFSADLRFRQIAADKRCITWV
jgi:hypothetical protein